MRIGVPFLFASSVVIALAACANLKVAETSPDTDDAPVETVDDGGPRADGGRQADGAPDGDVEEPPADFECKGSWHSSISATAECTPRQVRQIDPEEGVISHGISIARTEAGRVGVVYSNDLGIDFGELRLAHFVPASEAFDDPEIIVKDSGQFVYDGRLSKIAAVAPDTLSVLTYDREGDSGEV